MTTLTDLRARLERAAEAPRAALRDARGTGARRAALETALPYVEVVPALALVIAFLSTLGLPVPLPPWWVLLALTVVPVAAFVWHGWWSARSAPAGVMDGLALLDRELDIDDQLQSAYSLSRVAAPSSFVVAAIEDAEPHVERAAATTVSPSASSSPLSARALWAPLLAAAMLLIAVLVGGGTWDVGDDAGQDVADAPAPSAGPLDAPEEGGGDAEDSAERAARRASRLSAVETEAEESDAHALPDEARSSKGTGGAGESAAASDAQGASQARGMPSGQAESSTPPERRAARRPPKKKRDRDDEPPPPPKEDKEGDSGATAGSGASTGSNRNPAVSDWSSKDHVPETEDDPLEDDEDVDDEDDEQDNRGGAQPMLRDRKPPVNRDLTIGFGNRPSPDANGRGGPSQMKKSRGVASLILGVPIPDHVKGQQSPGRTKVTQERVEPREDDAPRVTAEQRTPRAGPAGAVVHPELGWTLRDLVRTYFLTLREQENTKP